MQASKWQRGQLSLTDLRRNVLQHCVEVVAAPMSLLQILRTPILLMFETCGRNECS